MAIQMRRGNYGKFDPSKLLPGEYAVVQGDDPSARDGRSVYMAFAAGVVKRLATYEDMVENVSSALVDAIGDAAERLTERAEAINAAAEEGEAGRREAEAARAAAESARTTAEEGRAKAEGERAAADADRETRQAKNDADQAQNNAAAMGMTYHVCPSSEYELDQVDGLHNVPTVAGKPGTMYLTPRVDGATGEDRYDQWLLVDGSWELMGETGSHIEPVTTDDVDAITSGGSVTADRYLNATGLTYWWAKARAALSSLFAAKSHTHAASAIASGTIAPARLPLATASAAGAVTVGDGLAVSGGRISVDNSAYVKSVDGWTVITVGTLCVCSRTWSYEDDATIDSAWGTTLLESTGAIALPDYPMEFSSLPASYVDYVGAEPGKIYAAFVERAIGSVSTKSPGSVYLVRPSGVTTTIGGPTFAITAVGQLAP